MATTETSAAPTTGYIEYLGEEPHGTAFLRSHSIPKNDPVWKRNRVEDAKAVAWERDPTGPGVGQKGNRMLVPIEDLTPAMVAVLEKLPGYKRVSE
jgi:hypothetical protein